MTRIDGTNALGTSRTQAGSAASGVDSSRQANRGAEASEQLAGPQDKVSVSFRSRLMAEASNAVATAPDVRQEKVLALKAQIANGTYAPDARDLAERLLGSLTA